MTACKARYRLSWGVQKGRQRKLSQGKCSFSCAAKPPFSEHGGKLHAQRKALGRAHSTDEVYKCAICSKGIYPVSPLSALFRRNALASSSVMSFASGTRLSKIAPRTISRWFLAFRFSSTSLRPSILFLFSSCRSCFSARSISAVHSSSQGKYHQIKNADFTRHSTASISSNVALFISFSKTLVAN